MDKAAVVARIMNEFDGLEVVEASGNRFFVHDPGGTTQPDRRFPIFTLVTNMEEARATSWQFSLRTLLLLTTACAVLAGAGRVFGFSVFVWVSFILLIATPFAFMGGGLMRAYLVALTAVWGPFAVMAAYTAAFVECSHCKAAAAGMLPYGPGFVSLELAHHLINLPRLDGGIAYAAGMLVSTLFAIVLTWLFRTRGWWVRGICFAVATAYFSFCAFALLAMIRA